MKDAKLQAMSLDKENLNKELRELREDNAKLRAAKRDSGLTELQQIEISKVCLLDIHKFLNLLH